MKVLFSLSLLGLLASSSAFSRTKTVTVTVNDPALKPTQFTLREQTTRKWLPGCMQYDFLQRTGWFPATFYFEADPVPQAAGVYFYEVPAPSPLSKYCAVKTDNVANGLGMEYMNSSGDSIAYGGLSYQIHANGQDIVDASCQWIEGENGDASSISCQPIVVSEAENIRIQINLVKP